MIPVELQPEPDCFEERVRKPGKEWLKNNKIPVDQPPPKASDLPSYWRECNDDLWEAYDGVCAYLAIYFECGLGAHSTDHFVAKSKKAGLAYEWSNYRLCCLGANSKKHVHDDVLDPIGLAPDTFVLNLDTGEIRPRDDLSSAEKKAAADTIDRLKLDRHDRMRAKHYTRYLRRKDEETFRELSPFVWYEAKRQGLL